MNNLLELQYKESYLRLQKAMLDQLLNSKDEKEKEMWKNNIEKVGEAYKEAKEKLIHRQGIDS